MTPHPSAGRLSARRTLSLATDGFAQLPCPDGDFPRLAAPWAARATTPPAPAPTPPFAPVPQ
ncbi:hypothetical protein ACFOOM_00460 [Streptomyces echinoruber]|uniref:Uncharacterized protein n=1 Tax=Streptomyces echinoruber TaxID=68898 RepID=A0A918QUZ8_9ACTN|nr:hypothetical protein [Streptomyces echinoruber]GGZ73954.1 hypothetical protein GCM10010389_09500 [Streptomyces echinoruber]